MLKYACVLIAAATCAIVVFVLIISSRIQGVWGRSLNVPISVTLFPSLSATGAEIASRENSNEIFSYRIPKIEFSDPLLTSFSELAFAKVRIFGPHLKLKSGEALALQTLSQSDEILESICRNAPFTVRGGLVTGFPLPALDTFATIDSLDATVDCRSMAVITEAHGEVQIDKFGTLDLSLEKATIDPLRTVTFEKLSVRDKDGELTFSGLLGLVNGQSSGRLWGAIGPEQIRSFLGKFVVAEPTRDALVALFARNRWSFSGHVRQNDFDSTARVEFGALTSPDGALHLDGSFSEKGGLHGAVLSIDNLTVPRVSGDTPWFFSKAVGEAGGNLRGMLRLNLFSSCYSGQSSDELQIDGEIDLAGIRIGRTNGPVVDTVLKIVSGKLDVVSSATQFGLTGNNVDFEIFGMPAEISSFMVKVSGSKVSAFEAEGYAFGGTVKGFLGVPDKTPNIEIATSDLDSVFRFLGYDGSPIIAKTGAVITGRFSIDNNQSYRSTWSLRVPEGGKFNDVYLTSGRLSEACRERAQGSLKAFLDAENQPVKGTSFESFQAKLLDRSVSKLKDVELQIGPFHLSGDLGSAGNNSWFAKGTWKQGGKLGSDEVICSQ